MVPELKMLNIEFLILIQSVGENVMSEWNVYDESIINSDILQNLDPGIFVFLYIFYFYAVFYFKGFMTQFIFIQMSVLRKYW